METEHGGNAAGATPETASSVYPEPAYNRRKTKRQERKGQSEKPKPYIKTKRNMARTAVP